MWRPTLSCLAVLSLSVTLGLGSSPLELGSSPLGLGSSPLGLGSSPSSQSGLLQPRAKTTAPFSTDLRCSTADLLGTPSLGLDNAAFTACAEVQITSTPDVVYGAILDFPSYFDWNKFVTKVTEPGDVQQSSDVYEGMKFQVTLSGVLPNEGDLTAKEVVSKLTPPTLIAWKLDGGPPEFKGVTAESLHLLTDNGDGTVLLVMYETYYGDLSVLGNLPADSLQTKFAGQVTNLKDYIEGGMS